MKRNKNVLSLLIVNFVFFLLLFTLIEGIFRVIGIPYKVKYIPNENSFARFNPELGWSYIPNNSSMHRSGHIVKPVHFDTNGVRVYGPDVELDYIKPSILFIGGSFTMGHGLSYKESFVGKIDASDEVPYQIVNLGVQGYGSDQALLSLKRYISKFNTKIVVYTFIKDHIFRNGNYDRRMLVPTAIFLGTKPQFALDNDNKLYLARKPLLYKNYFNSYVIDFIKIRISTILGNFPPYPEDLTKAIILEMEKISNESSAHFLVLDWKWTDDDEIKFLHDLDVDIIDTLEEAPPGWDEMVILGGVHPNEKASDHAAMLLLKYFRTKGLVVNELEK